MKNTTFRYALSSYINRQCPNGYAMQAASKAAHYLFKMLTFRGYIKSHDSKHNVIKHKYIGAEWSVVCTNVLVHYLKGNFMFFYHIV